MIYTPPELTKLRAAVATVISRLGTPRSNSGSTTVELLHWLLSVMLVKLLTMTSLAAERALFMLADSPLVST